MAEIEKLQRTLKKLIDLFFADFARGQNSRIKDARRHLNHWKLMHKQRSK